MGRICVVGSPMWAMISGSEAAPGRKIVPKTSMSSGQLKLGVAAASIRLESERLDPAGRASADGAEPNGNTRRVAGAGREPIDRAGAVCRSIERHEGVERSTACVGRIGHADRLAFGRAHARIAEIDQRRRINDPLA